MRFYYSVGNTVEEASGIYTNGGETATHTRTWQKNKAPAILEGSTLCDVTAIKSRNTLFPRRVRAVPVRPAR